MIIDALTTVGNTVQLRNVKAPLTDVPQGTQIIWHYGDIDMIDQQIAEARRCNVPIIINSTYDNLPDRRRWLIHKVTEDWDPDNKGDVFIGVFTNNLSKEIRLHKIWDRLIPIPKTIRTDYNHNPPFGARAGICLGELEKIGRPRLINDYKMIQEVTDKLLKELPGAPLYTFNQYGHQNTIIPPKVIVRPYDDESFISWLSTLRLYISLVAHETFSMVPAEAQSVGTPILYRHMPQSLTEHIGHTGFMFRSVDELTMAAKALYLSETRWEQMRLASIRNAKSRSVDSIGTAIDLALRRVLCKGDIIW
jgi:hypothetical protein